MKDMLLETSFGFSNLAFDKNCGEVNSPDRYYIAKGSGTGDKKIMEK